jgi:hypothetical protein
VKQTLETLREESEGVFGKAFERLKMAFLVMDMAAMVVICLCVFFCFGLVSPLSGNSCYKVFEE